jgi:hypothetical protein
MALLYFLVELQKKRTRSFLHGVNHCKRSSLSSFLPFPPILVLSPDPFARKHCAVNAVIALLREVGGLPGKRRAVRTFTTLFLLLLSIAFAHLSAAKDSRFKKKRFRQGLHPCFLPHKHTPENAGGRWRPARLATPPKRL